MSGDDIREVRQGEELDLEKLVPYLQEHIEDFGSHVQVKQFGAGHSNLTYLVEHAPHAGAPTSDLVLRRPPWGAESIATGHDMGREFGVLSRLHPVWDRVPEPILFCEDRTVIGAPFYVMERVDGEILRGPKPAALRGAEPTQVASICEALVSTLAEIHTIDLDAAGLADFGKPEGYIARQVTGWTKRWQRARTGDVPAVEAVATWLASHMPEPQRASLIHNDFKYDNLVLDPEDLSEVRAVLDWEMATIGDPLMDLGTSLAYWVEASDPAPLQHLRFGPTTLEGNDTRAELVERYAARTGLDTSNILFYYAYGLFKVAVVAEQIYARYKKGLTRDERFAGLHVAVQTLGEAAKKAIDTDTI